jgi:tetratricopeptide (TPR) repeat protein
MAPRGSRQDPIRAHLELGMVGVVAAGDTPGAGFLVDERHAVTCAHIINDALGRDSLDPERPSSVIDLNFPFADRSVVVPATVVAWRPVGSGHGDIAVLELQRDAPLAARPVRMVDANDVQGHAFVAWGFPLERAGEIFADGTIQRRRGDDRIQISANSGVGQSVRQGFSGTAVWDTSLGGVIGMVVTADATTRTAYLLPTDVIAEVWPSLQVHATRPVNAGERVVGDRVSASVDVFRDRTEFRARLRELVLSRQYPIICVTGRRGVGKSGLVARVLADFEEPNDTEAAGVGGLAYLSTRTGVGVLDVGRVYHELARLVDDEQRNRLETLWRNAGPEAVPELLSALRDYDAVLVLDNLDDVQDADTGALADDGLTSLLSSVCRTTRPPVVVTTSQRPLTLPADLRHHVRRIELDEGLEVLDAVQLLRRLDDNGDAGLRDLPDSTLLQVVERVYCMPRALELLVSLVADSQTATVQGLFDAGDTPEELLRALVSEGFASLDPVDRDVVRFLALADTPLPVTAFPDLLTEWHKSVVVVDSVDRLVHRRMLSFDRATSRVRLHPVDSDYVRMTLGAETDRQIEMDLRLADWLACNREGQQSWRTSTDVAPQRREIRHRLRAGDVGGALRVMAGIAEFLARQGEAALLWDFLKQVEGHSDGDGEAAMYELVSGLVEFYSGSLDDAIDAFTRGCSAASSVGEETLTARLSMWLGIALRQAGRPAEGRASLQRATSLSPKDDEAREIVLGSHFSLALGACYLGEVREAEEAIARAEAMIRPTDPVLWSAWMADARALTALASRDLAVALAEIEQGVARYAASPQGDAVGYLVNVRGLVHLLQGLPEDAEQDFSSTVHDAALLRQSRLAGLAGLNLAWTQLVSGNHAGAAVSAAAASGRLESNKVAEAASAEAVAAACASRDATTALELLRKAVVLSRGNPDLYQPPETELERMAVVASDGADV